MTKLKGEKAPALPQRKQAPKLPAPTQQPKQQSQEVVVNIQGLKPGKTKQLKATVRGKRKRLCTTVLRKRERECVCVYLCVDGPSS